MITLADAKRVLAAAERKAEEIRTADEYRRR